MRKFRPRSLPTGNFNSGRNPSRGFIRPPLPNHPQFNEKDHTGKYITCHICNSWFQLIPECPYKTPAAQIMFGDNYEQNEPEITFEDPQSSKNGESNPEDEARESSAILFAELCTI